MYSVCMNEIKRNPGRPTEEHKTERMLLSVGNIVRTEGLSALTMERVAREAKVSKATVYRRFQSKENLIRDYVRWTTNSHSPMPENLASNSTEPFEQLINTGCWLISLLGKKEVIQFDNALAASATSHPELASQVLEAGYERALIITKTALETLNDHQQFCKSVERDHAEALLGLWSGGILDRLRFGQREKLSPEELRNHVVSRVKLFFKGA